MPVRRTLAAATLGAALLAGVAQPAGAQSHEHGAAALGTVDFPVSCTPRARGEFARAVALLHHMTYPEARAAFERVAAADPGCAMAHWGVAMTLFQPLWPTRPRPDELRRGWDEAQRAVALRPPTERERLFVAAVEAFFRDPASPDYWARVRRWAAAMAAVHDAYPRDPEASAFDALALLAIAPPNDSAAAYAERAAALLLPVYRRNPAHPGAMHYLVHASDVPGRERATLAVVERYDSLAPRNPHALHMPTHIYTRLGDWDAVVRGNLLAASAALEIPAGANGDLVWDEFPHAVEYLVYAYLQQGADSAALAQVRRLEGTARLEPTFKTAFHLSSVAARYALERQAWDEAARLAPRAPASVGGPLPWDRFPWAEGVTWFARGLGAARGGGDLESARAAVARLGALDSAAAAAGEDLFARQIRVLRLGAEGWLRQAAGERDSAVAVLERAAALEAATPKPAVTPAPTIPAAELLGDLLLAQGRPAEALASYRRALAAYPRRFGALAGAARAARAAGDSTAARAFADALHAVAGGSARAAAVR